MAARSELAKEVEALLNDEDSVVVLAVSMSKNQASWTVTGRRGNMQSKRRILAVSAKRAPQSQRFKVRIHIIKPTPQGLEQIKAHKLSSLSSIELVHNDPSGRSLLLIFDEKKDSSVPQWTASSIDERNQLLVVILKMCRENLKTLPRVVGIDVVEIALWAKSNAKSLAVGVGDNVDSLGEERGGDESMVAQESLVSKDEEEDMEALLGTYVIGIDEAEAFSERLKRELGALEAANVHAILESEGLVEEVLESLDEAAERVDDMDEWLKVFNVKLRHMREEIESIEEQNNMLEVQAVNNKRLLDEVEMLLADLVIPPQCYSLLSSGPLDESRLPDLIGACDWLAAALRRLQPPELDPAYCQMRAVRDKTAELINMKTAFVRRMTDSLRTIFASAVDAAISERKSSRNPEYRELRRRLTPLAKFIQVLQNLEPKCAASIRKSYCTSLNLLVRKTVRDFSSDLRATVRVGGRSAAGGPFSDSATSAAAAASDAQIMQESYGKLLKTFVPFISDEVSFARHLLCFETEEDDRDSRQGEREPAELVAAMEQLFEGIQEDFLGMVDWAHRIDAIWCISMAGHTDSWLQYVEGEGLTQVSRKLLLELQTRIRELFFKYVEEANTQVERYERGAKQAGVLSFIPRFANLATRMEALIVNNCRDLVDLAYKKLVETMFATLRNVAKLDPKHADIFLLENFAAYQYSTYEMAQSIKILEGFYQQASESYEVACSRYIDSIIQGQFEKLLDYLHKIVGLLQTIDAEEIPFQIGFGKSDLRKVLRAQLATPDRSIAAMFQRIKKHLTSSELLGPLWERCQEDFLAKYEDLEQVVQRCYANETVSPTSSEIRGFFVSMRP